MHQRRLHTVVGHHQALKEGVGEDRELLVGASHDVPP
jgi:hypothetical protein